MAPQVRPLRAQTASTTAKGQRQRQHREPGAPPTRKATANVHRRSRPPIATITMVPATAAAPNTAEITPTRSALP